MEKRINKIKREKEKFEKLKEKLEKDKKREQEAKDKFIQSQKDILYDLFLSSKLNLEEFILKVKSMIENNKTVPEKNIQENSVNNKENQGE